MGHQLTAAGIAPATDALADPAATPAGLAPPAPMPASAPALSPSALVALEARARAFAAELLDPVMAHCPSADDAHARLGSMSPADRVAFDARVNQTALADMREALGDPDYPGVDATRMMRRGYPKEAVLSGWTFDNWPATTPARREALRLARLFAADHGAFARETGRPGLALAGETGRAKTSLATMIGRGLTGWSGAPGTAESIFVAWRDLMRECRDAIGQRGATAGAMSAPVGGVGAVVRRYTDAEVLVLDDLGEPGAGQAYPFDRQVLREILWSRYDRRAPLILTTNCDERDLEAQFGEAALSRLYGMAKWVVLDGDDERRQRRTA